MLDKPFRNFPIEQVLMFENIRVLIPPLPSNPLGMTGSAIAFAVRQSNNDDSDRFWGFVVVVIFLEGTVHGLEKGPRQILMQ